MTSEIGTWLEEVARDEKPPANIVAYNIGLFESPEGYCAYLSGATRYSEEDPEWARDDTYTPVHRYCVLGDLGGRDSGEVRRSVVESVRSFLGSPVGGASFLARAQAVTVGFDDGDLVPVKAS
ncbi:MAG: hypothetical protein ACM3PC_09610 [Deltaproteobacteria bacterium]